MSLDKIVRPYTPPDIFPTKTHVSAVKSVRAVKMLSFEYGKRQAKAKTVNVTNGGSSTTYTIKRPTEQNGR